MMGALFCKEATGMSWQSNLICTSARYGRWFISCCFDFYDPNDGNGRR